MNMNELKSYQPNLLDKIVVVSPYYKDDFNSIVYVETAASVLTEYATHLHTTAFVEHFLYLQGTSIRGSRTSARKLYNFSKNIPIYAPLTQQVIQKYRVPDCPDPIYFFTMLYTIEELTKKRSKLSLYNASFIVEASKHQCITQQQRASYYLLHKQQQHASYIFD